MDLENAKNVAMAYGKQLYENKPAFFGTIAIIGFIILVLLFKKYKELVKKGKNEPVFIRKVKRANESIQVSDDLITAPVFGSSFTYTSWIYINDWSHNAGSVKHVFHKGDEEFKSCAPAVWLLPNINSMAILFDTIERNKSAKKIDERKGIMPLLEPSLKITESVGHILPNQTECSCKGYLQLDDNAQQAFYRSDTKDCMMLTDARRKESEFVVNKNAITWTIENKNQRSMDPVKNPEILRETGNSIIVENIPLQRWFHVVIVINETAVEVYIDGKLYKTVVLESLCRTNSFPLYVNMNRGFDGLINELRYYPYPLKPMDVYSMYSRGPTPFYFEYLFKGKLELYEQKMKDAAAKVEDKIGKFVDKF
jgi:hypothetical protein